MITPKLLWSHVETLRAKAPLVHSITNLVVMNLNANALLSLGASPIMAHEPAELDDLIGIASALVLNIGTLDKAWIASMKAAALAAYKRAVPLVIDPVGAGASRLRTETALALIHDGQPAVIRANPSELMALAGAAGATKGVDSTRTTTEAREAARSLAIEFRCTAVASGADDLITNGREHWTLSGGSPLMPRITGMGCTSSAIVGAFTAVAEPLEAAVAGMAVMKVAAELAAEKAAGPGTMQIHFLDALHTLSAADFLGRVKLARG
jgi:hydroxyethylthiazole kinase